MRARRLDERLLQREVAELLGVTKLTVGNWETGRTAPDRDIAPRVIAFLGYEPDGWTGPRPAGAILAYRRARGLGRKALARTLGVNPATLKRWEEGTRWPRGALLRRLERTHVWRDVLRQAVDTNDSASVSDAISGGRCPSTGS